ncbi:IS1380 family transposase [Aquimarina sp. BL5]|uniref:IS1380 family transposase n=1 Tax=Aquimarina sp. BL5 TaxID=1714860 RepID=UPI000E51AEF5|nr:IS1380 family transposase [Aquimarina sp. BL5]AXT51162.1 IS1380 family transposase [Aquimarina sp. BL5]RKN09229.1 IS1380 family transposase [Aquimarina sp. BL5]
MKILNSSHINPFGGLNFVLQEFENKKIGKLLQEHLPKLPAQCKYSWKDILYSFWSIYFCGGDCIEDLGGNFHHHLKHTHFLNIPSPDRVLERFKELALPKVVIKSPRGKSTHELSINKDINTLNLKVLTSLGGLLGDSLTLDYDNTFIFNDKADSANTYKKRYGYCPGVGIVGNHIVYVENRNGNSNPRTLQNQTVSRMFDLLDESKIKIKSFRADSGSYLYDVVNLVSQKTDYFYITARMSAALSKAIASISTWQKIESKQEIIYRGETQFKPFIRANRDTINPQDLKTYRLVVSKIERNDKQVNLFTNEAYIYSAILTNDQNMDVNDVVFFYNQRGTVEKEFDVLKNDFGWDNLPFSKLEQNTVFMIFTAMCRNLYNYVITSFSQIFENLKSNFRIKKFIFRFITIPAKWVKTSRQRKLRIYGNIHFKT